MDSYDTDPLDRRYGLAIGRIAQIETDQTVSSPFDCYFREMARFVLRMDDIRQRLLRGETALYTLEQWQELNHSMYEDILPGHYEESFANPDHAAAVLGEELGRLLCFLYTQLRGLTGFIFEDRREESTVLLELLLEVYTSFESEKVPRAEDIRHILYWFCSDYCELFVTERVRQSVDPGEDFAVRIVTQSDLEDPRYLYQYGEYVTEQEIRMARYLSRLSEEQIGRMADTFTEGYRIGFVHGGKDLSKKLTVNIRYRLGFERVVRRAIENFRKMDLRPVIFRYALSSVNRPGGRKIGYEGAPANPQYDYDHREDLALYLDRRFVQRRLEVLKASYETFKTWARGHAGPAVIETFGEEPFAPRTCVHACRLDEKQQKLLTEMNNASARLTNQYIPGEERSFTIIAFPVPQIGRDFERIFEETMKINTLDNREYERIQQVLIDELDRGERVHIVGRDGNRTDLTVALAPLEDPFRQTNFENCVADVNIPVGEVFTTPRLEGTEGLLHVKKVFLNGLAYEDLELEFSEGMVSDYRCGNFDTPEENRAYVASNVLFHHETLPMGEFAIGTNTAAYVMAQRYHIERMLPILIAEKTGPHFAVGDTCYSMEEDNAVYNPDGKEVAARDNRISRLRDQDPARAYFGCHTDITLPYSELGLIEVISADGARTALLKNGRFVMKGTEKLNRVLDEAGIP